MLRLIFSAVHFFVVPLQWLKSGLMLLVLHSICWNKFSFHCCNVFPFFLCYPLYLSYSCFSRLLGQFDNSYSMFNGLSLKMTTIEQICNWMRYFWVVSSIYSCDLVSLKMSWFILLISQHFSVIVLLAKIMILNIE